ncbi:MAG: anthranilate phosphoribosyltransferase [Candidatus Margulisbacteria bacterium]|jgi:anthranilate synthase/phosphoribosyltransferase|nr:anthranilate phosphoribosyltransferase [Candidatus Margulisiibacteriota bacterium]
MILLIDNYDSFTYNLTQCFQMLRQTVKTVRNDKITLPEIEKLKPTHIVISPGPGDPSQAGISVKAVRHFAGKIPILGVCLGHQAIVAAFGGAIIGAKQIIHGKTDTIQHDEGGVFRNLQQGLTVVRYHSLAADPARMPDCLEATAFAARDQAIMAVRHRKYQIEGVQFHPESFSAAQGLKLLENFLKYKRAGSQKLTLLRRLSLGENLTQKEAATIMDEITDGELTDSQLGAFLGSYAVKGISPEELSGFALAMRQKMTSRQKMPGALDIVGTGGDGQHTFNISSAAALVCAHYGVPVAKHGNRAFTSSSGSFDFLQALQVKTDGDLPANLKSLRKNNFAFFFAPLYHPAMKYVGRVRQEVKFRTVFNLLGPLINPLQVGYQMIGVYDPSLLDLFIQTLKKLGLQRALVVHAESGIDEISICGKTHVRELTAAGKIKAYKLDPQDFGIRGFKSADLRGGTARQNAEMFLRIIQGGVKTRKDKALAAAVALNAGAALYLFSKAKTIPDGYARTLRDLKELKLAGCVDRLF